MNTRAGDALREAAENALEWFDTYYPDTDLQRELGAALAQPAEPGHPWAEDWSDPAMDVYDVPAPLHLAAGENLSRCGIPVGDICSDCEDSDGK